MENTKQMFCDNCNKNQNFNYKRVNRDYKVKGESINVDTLVSECSVCHEEIWKEELIKENEKIIFTEYRKRKGLLFPDDIKEIRTKYGLTQKDLALLLGFGEKTITRYENGALQDETHNLLLNLLKNEYLFYTIFEINRSKLNSKIIEEIEEKFIKQNCTSLLNRR